MSLFRDLLIEKKRKPYYCEIEYIESSGTQYIDTGVNADSNLGFETYCQLTATTANQYMGAIKQISNGYTRHHLSVMNDSVYSYHLSTLRYDFTIDTNLHYIKYNAQTHVLTFDTTTQNTTTDTFDTGLTYWLFARNANSGMSTMYMNIKIYFFKMTYNGTLVRDFIPVLDWNYIPCLYDKVSGKKFYNQGTGSFSYGREIHYVEYLESTGTQYINTKYIPSMNTGARGTVEWTDISGSNDNYFLGCRNATTGDTRFWIGCARGSTSPNYLRGAIGGLTSSTISVATNDKKNFEFNYNGNHKASWGADSYDITGFISFTPTTN